MSSHEYIFIAAYALAGACLAAMYLWALRHTVSLIVEKVSVALIAPLYLVRFGVVVAAFWIVVQQGAGALLSLLAGFTIVRLFVRRYAEES